MKSQSETTQTVSVLKLPVLKTREYNLWSMRMEQYLTFTEHALWEVIVNGDLVTPVPSDSAGVEGPFPPKTAEQKLAKKNELIAKSTLMLAIPDEHLLKFHACKDAKSLWEAIKNSQEGLDKTYDRFQKLISQIEIHGEVISHEDANLKLLRSLPSAWNNIALIMRNKSDLDTLSIDDLYNNLKVYESDIKGQSSSSSNSQNVAFVSSDNSSSTNKIFNTAYSVSAASSKDQASTASYADDVMFSFFTNQSNAPQLYNEDLEQIDADDLEEMDFKCAKDKTGLGYDGQMNESVVINIHVNESEVLDNVFDSRESDVDDNQVSDRFKKGEGYHVIPPPYTRNYMPPRADLSFAGSDDSIFKSKVSETVTNVPKIKTNAFKTSKDSLEKPKTVRSSAPLIEQCELDIEDENVFNPKEVKKKIKPSFEKIEFVDARNTTVENERKAKKPRKFTVVLTKSGQVPVNTTKQSSNRAAASVSTARRVNITASRPNVNDALPSTFTKFFTSSIKHLVFFFKIHGNINSKANSSAKTNNFNEKVNIARVDNVTTVGLKAVVSAAERNRDNVVKSLACWI
uniref:Uncharacterized protein n=1 Tax=Tanacetum cinerariifolium TaxID=118510 RepID=A0A6L2K733_TANCI|nr:hypothetical protein [Tanacetum cinerariifolium]